MVWAFVIVLVLLIPILAIIIDSQVGQALAERISSRRAIPTEEDWTSRLETLENEVRYLTEAVESLREESEFVRSLVEARPAARELGSGEGEETSPGSRP